MRRLHPIALLIALIGCGSSFAESDRSTIEPDRAKAGMRGEGVSDGLQTGKATAKLVHSGALFLSELANRYRLDRNTKAALQSQLPEIAAGLRKSGAAGMLLEARFAVSTVALRCGDDCGPPNMTQTLIGDRLNVIGEGRDPNDVVTLALSDERRYGSLKSGAPSRDETELPSETHNYWVTLDQDRNPIFKELDHKDLYGISYLRLRDKAGVEQLKRSSYGWALDDMARSLVVNASSRELRLSADALLKARDKARQDMQSINDRLKSALDAASRANADADRIALAAALAGTASTVLSSYQTQVSNKQPSPATIELLRQRVDIETNLQTNETNIRAQAEKRSYTIWMNKPD